MNSWNDESSYLTALISITSVIKRSTKSAVQESGAKLRNNRFHYNVWFVGISSTKFHCFNCFDNYAWHHKTEDRDYSVELDDNWVDLRGRYGNRPHKIPESTMKAVKDQIKSFKGRCSHYTLRETTKVYLPKELNVQKLIMKKILKIVWATNIIVTYSILASILALVTPERIYAVCV